jgi:hypothetical protein
MILTLKQKFELDLPVGWRELPPASVLATDTWIYEWVEVAGVPVECRESLAGELQLAASLILSNLDQSRTWMTVADPTDPSIVGALASIVAFEPVDSDSPSSVSAIGRPALPEDRTVSWMAETIETTIADHPALVLHDTFVFTFERGPELIERYVGTLFPDAPSDIVQLEILTSNTSSFGDLVGLGNAVLAGLRETHE